MPFARDAQIVIEALDRYIQESLSGAQPVIDQAPMADLIAGFELDAHVRAGGLSGERLAAWLEAYLAATTRLHHPAYMAHQCAIPHYAGALGR